MPSPDGTLPGLSPATAPGDNLERGYTPQPVAEQIVNLVAASSPQFAIVLEAHVGSGSFIEPARRAWPTARVVGVDLDPEASGFARVDEFHLGDLLSFGDLVRGLHDDCERNDEHMLVLGNPPFSSALQHIQFVRSHAPSAAIAWILPWSRWALRSWRPVLVDDPPYLTAPLVPRPWPDIGVRDVGLFVWGPSYLGSQGTRLSSLHWK